MPPLKVLMVAEKPSVAKEIARHLSAQGMPNRVRPQRSNHTRPPGEHRVRPFTFTPLGASIEYLSPACLRALGTHHLLQHAHTLTRTRPPLSLRTHDTAPRPG